MPRDAEGHSTGDREIVVSRRIEGPRHLVFEAFTDANHLGQWWGPNGFTITTHVFDFRVGGVWEFIMHDPDGTDFPNRIVWQEIVPPERLVYFHAEHEDDPNAFTSTVTFADRGDATDITLTAVFPTKEQRDEAVRRFRAIEGGEQTLGRLADYVTALIAENGPSRADR
jgi:uncharacterized protein YndB with AHSA1/START domain